jgi:hypothetical protein
MNRNPETGAQFFVGTEVEHTPAYGKTTLFVVGVQDIEKIQDCITDTIEPIEHIYFGANMSFPKLEINDAAGWKPWEVMIRHFLDQGHLCTLDIDVACVEGLLESGLTEYHNFIPMISVKLPYIDQLGYNATVKIDDRGFRATNPGVWCHSVHELKNRRVFTDWSKYTKDLEL